MMFTAYNIISTLSKCDLTARKLELLHSETEAKPRLFTPYNTLLQVF